MFQFYKKECDSPLIYTSPFVCCLLDYRVIFSGISSLTSQVKRETFTVSMPMRGIVEVPNQVAAGLCTILILTIRLSLMASRELGTGGGGGEAVC